MVHAFSDSDWAGCRVSAKSTSGGVLMRGRHCLRTYSVTQKNITLSSAEAELVALVRCTSEAIGVSQLAQGWGRNLGAHVFVASSAALSIATRRGVGKLRHVRIGHLWVQERAAEGDVQYKKVAGEDGSEIDASIFSAVSIHQCETTGMTRVPSVGPSVRHAISCPNMPRVSHLSVWPTVALHPVIAEIKSQVQQTHILRRISLKLNNCFRGEVWR